MKSTIFCLLVGLAASAGHAQNAISAECCPQRDCRVDVSNGVAMTDNGYHIVDLDIDVSVDDPRVGISPDGQFHVCSRAEATPNMSPSKFGLSSKAPTLKCLLVPAMS